MTPETSKTSSTLETVICPHHPIVAHYLGILRDKNTPTSLFRDAAKRLSHFVLIDALKALPLVSKTIETPVQPTEVKAFSPKLDVLFIPILRAGLAMEPVAVDLLPDASVYHIGLKRNEETLQAETYYQRLPELNTSREQYIVILDPMLATAGSAVTAIGMLIKRGFSPKQIKMACLIASPEGVKHLSESFPDVQIYAAAVDEKLNEKGYIVPGLGDAGDRTFGTP